MFFQVKQNKIQMAALKNRKLLLNFIFSLFVPFLIILTLIIRLWYLTLKIDQTKNMKIKLAQNWSFGKSA